MAEKREAVLLDREEIKKIVKEVGKKINESYDGEVVLISLLRGSFVFAADLCREISLPVVIDFMTTSSYGDDGEVTSGKVDILFDVRENLEGKDVIIVDDICDSGNTLKEIVGHISKKNPKSIKTAVMLDKPSRRLVDISPDFIGKTIEDVFIVGYGLNYGNHYRNCPYIFTFED